jgi:hypothetical protein
MAHKLPVRVEEGNVLTDDGMSWPFQDAAMGLLYYNPLAPQRLVYWIASDTPAFYQPEAPLFVSYYEANLADFRITHATQRQQVANRRFDSRWQWQPGHAGAPPLPEPFCTAGGEAGMLAAALAKAADADFALVSGSGPLERTTWRAGQSRTADIVAADWPTSLVLMEITGRQILDATPVLAGASEESFVRFLPQPDAERLDSEQLYRVVMLPWTAWTYARILQDCPPMRSLELDPRDALRRYLD